MPRYNKQPIEEEEVSEDEEFEDFDSELLKAAKEELEDDNGEERQIVNQQQQKKRPSFAKPISKPIMVPKKRYEEEVEEEPEDEEEPTPAPIVKRSQPVQQRRVEKEKDKYIVYTTQQRIGIFDNETNTKYMEFADTDSLQLSVLMDILNRLDKIEKSL